jgi:hypothetical protein
MYAYSQRTSRSSRTPYCGARFTLRSSIAALCAGLLLIAALLYASASDAQRNQIEVAAPNLPSVSDAMEIDGESPRSCCDPLSSVY